jgi:deoxycytidylate deaminase
LGEIQITLNIEKLLIVKDEKSRELLKRAYNIAWVMSTDTSTKTGAVSINKNNIIMGYNYLTLGVELIPEWKERPLKYYATVHAEIDAITKSAK